jgi:ElaB/YqjD/DUF883 family membrane-anchored ribosome-binding protein
MPAFLSQEKQEPAQVVLRKPMEISMPNDSKSSKDNSTTGDLEEVTRQLAALRADMAKLADTVSGIAGRRSRGVAADIAEGFSEASHYAEEVDAKGRAQLESSVAAHPLLAIGLAAGAGFMVGALSRR